MKNGLKKLARGTWSASVSPNGLKGIRQMSEALKARAKTDLEVSKTIDRSLERLDGRDPESEN